MQDWTKTPGGQSAWTKFWESLSRSEKRAAVVNTERVAKVNGRYVRAGRSDH